MYEEPVKPEDPVAFVQKHMQSKKKTDELDEQEHTLIGEPDIERAENAEIPLQEDCDQDINDNTYNLDEATTLQNDTAAENESDANCEIVPDNQEENIEEDAHETKG